MAQVEEVIIQTKKRPNVRRRTQTEDDGEETKIAKVAKTNIRNQNNPLVQNAQTKDPRSKPAAFNYESTKSAMPFGSTDQGATAHLETEPIPAPNASGNKLRAGPIKPPLNVRLTCRFDYQPDLCKDYKESGYCGYGDNCKFLHDRGDYKTGWQLEEEWEAKKSGKSQEEENLKIANDDDELPVNCSICNDPFDNPIVTKCGHFFCMECAVKHDKTQKTCFICNEKTNSIFNRALKLIKKQKTEK